MVRAIKMDLQKLFGDYHIYTCMIGLAFVYMLVHVQSIGQLGETYTITAAYDRIVSGNEIMLICFLFGVIGGSFLYCAEEQYGYLGFGIQRVGTGIYTISKLVVSFLGGICTVFAGQFLFILGILGHKFLFLDVVVTMEERWKYMMWTLVFSAVRSGILSAIGFLVTTYMANFYIGMTMPLLIYYGILELEYWFGVLFPTFPDGLYFSTRYNEPANGEFAFANFVFTMLYTAAFMAVLYGIAKRRIERRMEHV